MNKTRIEQVIESNDNIDNMIERAQQQRGGSLSTEELNTLTLTSINKQLADISITLAMICDALIKVKESD